MSSWSHTHLYNIYSSVGSQSLNSRSIIGLKLRLINRINSFYRCYRVEMHTIMHLTFVCKLISSKPILYINEEIDLSIINLEIHEDIKLKSVTFNF